MPWLSGAVLPLVIFHNSLPRVLTVFFPLIPILLSNSLWALFQSLRSLWSCCLLLTCLQAPPRVPHKAHNDARPGRILVVRGSEHSAVTPRHAGGGQQDPLEQGGTTLPCPARTEPCAPQVPSITPQIDSGGTAKCLSVSSSVCSSFLAAFSPPPSFCGNPVPTSLSVLVACSEDEVVQPGLCWSLTLCGFALQGQQQVTRTPGLV